MKPLLWVSPALYAVACCLPAMTFTDPTKGVDVMLGLRALTVGWSGIFAGITAWYANPFWLGGMLLLYFRKPVPALVCGVLAVAIAVSTFTLVGRILPADDGNVNKMTVLSIGPGAYVWLVSLVVLPIAALVQKIGR